MISICVCDPQPVVREGLRALLERQERLRLLGACDRPAEAVRMAQRMRPNVLLIDRGQDFEELAVTIRGIRNASPQTEVVVWNSEMDDAESFRAIQAGARAALSKTADADEVVECLEAAARKEIWTESLRHLQDARLDRPRHRPLTSREREIAALVSNGLKNREIAETLGIATGTVKIHLMHIFEKTGLRDRYELALCGLQSEQAS